MRAQIKGEVVDLSAEAYDLPRSDGSGNVTGSMGGNIGIGAGAGTGSNVTRTSVSTPTDPALGVGSGSRVVVSTHNGQPTPMSGTVAAPVAGGNGTHWVYNPKGAGIAH